MTMTVSEPSVTANSSSSPQSNVPESSTPSYAFLVHSQKTLTQNLPPRVDNKLLARQKRRRTRYSSSPMLFIFRRHLCFVHMLMLLWLFYSPEDHAILEAEYRKNPKPDKAARASIVSRVALGEKEVQVRVSGRVFVSSFSNNITRRTDMVPKPPTE
jgi:hypothetical protein